jgi:hypothetical protein
MESCRKHVGKWNPQVEAPSTLGTCHTPRISHVGKASRAPCDGILSSQLLNRNIRGNSSSPSPCVLHSKGSGMRYTSTPISKSGCCQREFWKNMDRTIQSTVSALGCNSRALESSYTHEVIAGERAIDE